MPRLSALLNNSTVFAKRLFFAGFLLMHVFCAAQNGTWTWISGDTLSASSGNFGVLGVPAPSNVPPALYETAE